MVIHFVPSLIKMVFPGMTWNRERNTKSIYLTFDDGPVPGATDFVLDELGKRDMKANFFVVGDNVRKHPELAKSIVDHGHGIGNHTYNHLKGSAIDDQVYLENIEKCSRVLEEVTGRRPTLFRPPYGRIRNSQIKQLRGKYELIMWDVLSGDYDVHQPATVCLSKTKKYTQGGSIVLFHDQQKTEKVLRQILPDYLDYIQLEGFETALL